MRQSQPTHRHLAFTLIEVLIVVAIIGLAGALVVPRMLSSGTLGVQAASRIVIADLLYAQNEAMARQSPRSVTFDPDNNAYKLTTADGTVLNASWKGGAKNNYQVDFEHNERFRGVNMTSASFDDDDHTITFNDLGAPDSGGNIDLEYRDEHLRINVAEFTGRVTVKRIE